jgi:DeoR/GlpR family transcriptional regulator of sugar metabolism
VHDFWNSPFTIISSGGRLRPHSLALTGDMACDALQRYFVDLAIISCKGLDQEKGVMESNEAESTIKQVMMRQAKKTILLADHTKFDQTAFVKTCGFDKIATLITDENPGHAWMDFLAKQDIEVIF